MIRTALLSAIVAFSIVSAKQPQQTDLPSDFIVEAFISNQNPYVGEQILYVFRYFAYITPDDLTNKLPGFEGFWVSDIYELSDNRVETIEGQQYLVQEIYVEISPLKIGEIVIEPSILNIPETVFRPGTRLETESHVIHVKPLPSEAPEGFTGAVGQFNVELQTDQSTITLGQPITMKVTVDGTGGLEQLRAPTLPPVDGWRIYPFPSKYIVSPLGGLRFGQKIFEWLLIPENAGSQTFPSIIFTYFDPQLSEYHSTILPPFTVEVFPGEGNISSLQLSLPNTDGATQLDIKQVTQQKALLPSSLGAWFWFLWVVSPSIFMIIVTYRVGHKIYWTQRKQRIFLNALSIAKAQLEHAAKAATPQTMSRNTLQAAHQYLANKLGTKQTEWIVLRRHLAIHLDEKLLEQLEREFADITGVQYIPTKLDYDIRPQVIQLYETLVEIDRRWQSIS